MSERRYTYLLQFSNGGGEWQIVDMGDKGYCSLGDPVVWKMPHKEEHWELDEPPAELRAEYERLIGWNPQEPNAGDIVNIVELISDEDGGFDQPCAYGNRVGGHAVYCHNDWWLYSPRKCRRTWYTGGEQRDEDCKGYRPNPNLGAKEA